MDLGNNTQAGGWYDGHSTAELLAEIHTEVTGRQASEIREWAAIVAWADHNTLDC